MWRDCLGKPWRLFSIVALVAAAIASIGVLPAVAKVPAASASQASPSDPDLRREVTRGFAGAVAPSQKPLTGAACSPLFSVVSSANASTANELQSVAAIFPTDMWAVGFSNAGGSASDRTLAEHWNGTSWAAVATPNVGGGFNDLNGVAANDSNDVWAVGNSQTGAVFGNLAMHWNGSSWAVVATPQPSATFQSLGGVSALGTNNVWAAGAYRNGANLLQTLVLHWNGSTWSTVVSPNAGSGANFLETVFARSATDVWAVGYYRASPGTTRLTLIEHYDGSLWSIQSSPNPVGDNTLLNVSATSATDVWAVGYTLNGTLAQTLTEHLVSGTWMAVASPNIGTGNNVLFGLVAISPTNAWASGFGKLMPATGGTSLVEHWDGSAWTVQSADSPGAGGNGLFGLAGLPGNNVWAVGGAFASGPAEGTLVEQFQLPAPTGVSAASGVFSATVSWTAPACDGGFTTTGYQVTAADGCAVQGTWAAPSSPFSVPAGLASGTAVSFVVQAVSASLGSETPSAPSAAVIPTGAPGQLSACSSKQYQYVSPDPTTFVDMDTTVLTLSFKPSADVLAIITGNADLWTANAGLNQDIGIFVSGGAFGAGQVVAWKESGGFAGTFSPNAAAVQTVVPLSLNIDYIVKLQWKSSKSFPGAGMFAAAGPIGGDYRWSGSKGYSPTRLSVKEVPAAAAQVFTASTNKQYSLAGSDGLTFVDMDTGGLSKSITPTVDSVALITGNADLWTANAGFNQDIAIKVDTTIASWKESGGFAGTFSPNAAFVQAVVPMLIAGSPHTVKLQWKTNQPEGGATVYAGAGPWPAATTFSPTRLTVWLLPTASINPAVSTLQYSLANSDGAGWSPIDSSALKLTVPPGSNSYTTLSGNVDLWTANAGFNQDVGIFVSGGVYGTGTLVAWKESGGLAGTFSPNAAYVETVQLMQSGTTYTIWLAWKTNNPAPGAAIYAAAGPWPAGSATFSPTRLTAILG